jgi:gliding motility-associated-like protein
VRDFFNCEASSNALVKQLNCCTVWVPGAFSPTGEDINRQLHLKSTALFTSFNFSIYNRHGQQVFATTDINKSWDGNLDGEPMAMDNYYYYLTFSCPNDDNIIKQKGDVFLLR